MGVIAWIVRGGLSRWDQSLVAAGDAVACVLEAHRPALLDLWERWEADER
jgi:hypothetical protein